MHTCRFCLGPGPLRKSHVIPDAMYEELFDESHRMARGGVDQRADVVHLQSGIWDRILCATCEDLFNSRWDDFGVEVYRDLVARIKAATAATFVLRRDVDHPRFRLFQLSILWRASVSRHRWFARVQLGPHEDKIRDILTRNDAESAGAYPCMMVGFVPSPESFGAVTDPVPRRLDSIPYYDFILPRMRWGFVVSSHLADWMVVLNDPRVIRVQVVDKPEDELVREIYESVERKRVSAGRGPSRGRHADAAP